MICWHLCVLPVSSDNCLVSPDELQGSKGPELGTLNILVYLYLHNDMIIYP